MIQNIFIIGIGSFLGGIFRFLLITLIKNNPLSLPWGTLSVNIFGCLVIGLLHALFERHHFGSPELRMFLTIGICGGFTTFSSFINELFHYLGENQYSLFFLYALSSFLGGLISLGIGYFMGKHLCA